MTGILLFTPEQAKRIQAEAQTRMRLQTAASKSRPWQNAKLVSEEATAPKPSTNGYTVLGATPKQEALMKSSGVRVLSCSACRGSDRFTAAVSFAKDRTQNPAAARLLGQHLLFLSVCVIGNTIRQFRKGLPTQFRAVIYLFDMSYLYAMRDEDFGHSPYPIDAAFSHLPLWNKFVRVRTRYSGQ